MKQFLLPRIVAPGESLELGGADYHYLYRVRRVKKGQKLTCRTPAGALLNCIVEKITENTNTMSVSVVSYVESPSNTCTELPNSTRIHLVQCIPKGKKLDLIVRQAVELGVTKISLIQSRNSIADFSERWDSKKEHLEGVMREAYQQSGATVLPLLEEPRTFDLFLDSYAIKEGDLGLFFHERELEKSTLHGYLEHIPHEIRMVVGPEGGLAPEELHSLTVAGYRPVYLGQQVLRCETAAAVGLGAIALIVREHFFWSTEDRKPNAE